MSFCAHVDGFPGSLALGGGKRRVSGRAESEVGEGSYAHTWGLLACPRVDPTGCWGQNKPLGPVSA